MEENLTAQREPTGEELTELLQIRRDKLCSLQQAGRDPFMQTSFSVSHTSEQIKGEFSAFEGRVVSIAGRMMANEPIWLRDFFATSTLWYWGFVLGLTLLVLLTGWRRKPAPAPAPDRN